MKIALFILAAVLCVVFGNEMPTILYTEACAETSVCQMDASATCSKECWDDGNGGTECIENWYDSSSQWVLCSL